MYNWKLTNGQYTNSREEYLDDWAKLIKELEERFNVKVKAFDPDISFVDSTKENFDWVSIPVWFAKKIIN